MSDFERQLAPAARSEQAEPAGLALQNEARWRAFSPDCLPAMPLAAGTADSVLPKFEAVWHRAAAAANIFHDFAGLLQPDAARKASDYKKALVNRFDIESREDLAGSLRPSAAIYPSDNPGVSPDTAAVEERLNRDISGLSDSEKQEFDKDMGLFLNRAAKQGLNEASEVDKTLQYCDQLLNPQGSAFLDQLYGSEKGRHLRNMLAEQIMSEAAYHSLTDQGVYGTCPVASLETRTWFDRPSVAAGVIADEALSGQWTANDGHVVKLPQLDFEPDKYSEKTVPRDGMRTYAGQIFQATALSDIGSRGHVDEGQEEYYLSKGVGADGAGQEYWADASGHIIQDHGSDRSYAGLSSADQIAEEAVRLDGDKAEVLCSSPGSTNDHVLSFSTKAELIDKLTEAQKQGRMPVQILVAGYDQFFANGDGPHELNHAICVDSYDPETRTVVVDNQWGSRSDWGTSTVLGAPGDRNSAASIDDFFPATQGSAADTSGRMQIL